MSNFARCVAIRGGDHEKQAMPCQDTSGYWNGNNCTIIAVADGHGSSQHFRSNIGSKIAVEVSIRILKKKIQSRGFIPRLQKEGLDGLVAISDEIVDEWDKAVEEYELSNPTSEMEKSFIKGSDNPHTKYGCTLIVLAKTAEVTLAIQIGDGHVYAIGSNGEIFSNLIDEDPFCASNITSSLCDNPKNRFRYYLDFNEKNKGFLLCSDGFYNSYGEPQDCTHEILRIFSVIDSDFEWNLNVIPRVNDLANNYSGDDVSIAVLCNEDSNFQLFEALCIDGIPKASHIKQMFRPSFSIITSGYVKDGALVEAGRLMINGFCMEGVFKDKKLTGDGLLRYPSVYDDERVFPGVSIPTVGLFMKSFYVDGQPNPEMSKTTLESINEDASKYLYEIKKAKSTMKKQAENVCIDDN